MEPTTLLPSHNSKVRSSFIVVTASFVFMCTLFCTFLCCTCALCTCARLCSQCVVLQEVINTCTHTYAHARTLYRPLMMAFWDRMWQRALSSEQYANWGLRIRNVRKQKSTDVECKWVKMIIEKERVSEGDGVEKTDNISATMEETTVYPKHQRWKKYERPTFTISGLRFPV